MKAITWGPDQLHNGSPDCPADARDVHCMIKGPEWEEWRTVPAHKDHTDTVYWPNVTAYRISVTAPDTVTADLVAAVQAARDWFNGGNQAVHDLCKQLDAAITAYKEKQG